MDKLKRQMEFIIEIDKLKSIFRQSLVTGENRHESDAEHSWHICMMAVVLEEYAEKGTDILHCIKMLLIHDLVEIYAGDTYLYDEADMKTKGEREALAADKLYSLLDSEQEDFFKKLWLEFEECKTKEAKFANILDRIQPIMLNYLSKGKMWQYHKVSKKQVIQKSHNVFEFADERLSKYLSDIINECVEKGFLNE